MTSHRDGAILRRGGRVAAAASAERNRGEQAPRRFQHGSPQYGRSAQLQENAGNARSVPARGAAVQGTAPRSNTPFVEIVLHDRPWRRFVTARFVHVAMRTLALGLRRRWRRGRHRQLGCSRGLDDRRWLRSRRRDDRRHRKLVEDVSHGHVGMLVLCLSAMRFRTRSSSWKDPSRRNPR